MNQRGKIKSFGVLKTATIGGIVTAALIVVPLALFLVLFSFVHVAHLFTHKTVVTPTTVFQPTAVATPKPCAQAAENKQPHPMRRRDELVIFAIFPLIYGAFGFILFGAWSWLYNVLSPRFGGIEIEWTDSSEEKPPLS